MAKEKERPPTLDELNNIEQEICAAELQVSKDRRVFEVMDFLRDAQDNPALEHYLEIQGVEDDDLFSPKSFLITRNIIKALLLLIEKTGTMTKATGLLGVNNSTISVQRKNHPALAAAMLAATNRFAANLIDKAADLALNGWQEEVYGKGKDGSTVKVGTKTKMEPRLLETLLAANIPRYKKQQLSDSGGQKVEVHLNFGDGSKEIIDGITGETIRNTTQLEAKALPAPSVELHDPGFADVEEGEL